MEEKDFYRVDPNFELTKQHEFSLDSERVENLGKVVKYLEQKN